MSGAKKIEVYIDYLCPYANAGSVWLRNVREQSGGAIDIAWRFFPLEQVNSEKGPDWKVWEQGEDHKTRGWEGFRAALAARQQGPEAFEKFHFGWFAALHDTPVGQKRPTIHQVAEAVGLNMEQFERDFSDRSLWPQVGSDYEHGKQELGVFGTPTIVFEDGTSAYIQMRPPAPAAETLAVWEDFVQTITARPYIKEIKRPTKPE